MPFISKAQIDKTWLGLCKMNGREIERLQKRHAKAQNALTKTTYADIDDYREEAFSVFLLAYHVVLEAFEKARPKPKRIGINSIKNQIPDVEFNLSMDINVKIMESSEPQALQYVYDTFIDPDNEVVLSDLEFEKFFIKMILVIECLHNECQRN